jgi:DNA polymerase I-like protein with 3'-5' exonuclease and polymerase domains
MYEHLTTEQLLESKKLNDLFICEYEKMKVNHLNDASDLRRLYEQTKSDCIDEEIEMLHLFNDKLQAVRELHAMEMKGINGLINMLKNKEKELKND